MEHILSGKHARHLHFSIYGAYLFYEHVVRALHVDGCNGHLNCDKTLALFGETYSWPHLNRAVQRFASYAKFVSMLRAKRKTIGWINHYSPTAPWEDLNIDFVLGLLKISEKWTQYSWYNYIDYIKFVHFMQCLTKADTFKIAVLFSQSNNLSP